MKPLHPKAIPKTTRLSRTEVERLFVIASLEPVVCESHLSKERLKTHPLTFIMEDELKKNGE